jgi:hypothetical protein
VKNCILKFFGKNFEKISEKFFKNKIHKKNRKKIAIFFKIIILSEKRKVFNQIFLGG